MTRLHIRTLAATLLVTAATVGFSACTTDGTPLASPSDLSAPPTSTASNDDDYDYDYRSPTSTTVPRTTSTEPPISDVPPPPDSTSITCREFLTMDKSHQIAVLKGVGATRNFEVVATLFSITCRATPDATIYDLIHNPPR